MARPRMRCSSSRSAMARPTSASCAGGCSAPPPCRATAPVCLAVDRDGHGLPQPEHVAVLVERPQRDAVAAGREPVAVDAQVPATVQGALVVPAERDAADAGDAVAVDALDEDPDGARGAQPGVDL